MHGHLTECTVIILGVAGIMSVKWPVECKRTYSCHFLQEGSLRMTCCYNLLGTSPGSLCRESGAHNWVFWRWFKNTFGHYCPSHGHIFYFLYFTSPYRDRVSWIWCGCVRRVNDYLLCAFRMKMGQQWMSDYTSSPMFGYHWLILISESQ